MMVGRWKILDDPDKRLIGLKRAMRNKILRKAVRAGSKPIRQAMKANAPKRTGSMGSSMSVRIATNKKTGAVYAVIGPRRRFQKKGVKGKVTPTKYAALVVGGTKPHAIGKGSTLGRKRGKRIVAHNQRGGLHPGSKSNPFMQRSHASTRESSLSAMRKVIEDGIVEALAKSGGAASTVADAG